MPLADLNKISFYIKIANVSTHFNQINFSKKKEKKEILFRGNPKQKK